MAMIDEGPSPTSGAWNGRSTKCWIQGARPSGDAAGRKPRKNFDHGTNGGLNLSGIGAAQKNELR